MSEKVSEKCNGIRIRRMNESDPAIFCREERKQGGMRQRRSSGDASNIRKLEKRLH